LALQPHAAEGVDPAQGEVGAEEGMVAAEAEAALAAARFHLPYSPAPTVSRKTSEQFR
jgi:hypothetical protein